MDTTAKDHNRGGPVLQWVQLTVNMVITNEEQHGNPLDFALIEEENVYNATQNKISDQKMDLILFKIMGMNSVHKNDGWAVYRNAESLMGRLFYFGRKSSIYSILRLLSPSPTNSSKKNQVEQRKIRSLIKTK